MIARGRPRPGVVVAGLTAWSLLVAPVIGVVAALVVGGGASSVAVLFAVAVALAAGAALAAGMRWFSLVFVLWAFIGSAAALLVLLVVIHPITD